MKSNLLKTLFSSLLVIVPFASIESALQGRCQAIEACLRLGVFDLRGDSTRGRANFRATRLYASTWTIRRTFARNVRTACGRLLKATRGALGISRDTSLSAGMK